METVKVDQLSKYGVKVGNEYYNWSKKISETEKGTVVPGGVYEMDLWAAESGKKYINRVFKTAESPTVAIPTRTDPEVPVVASKSKSSVVTKVLPSSNKKSEEMTRADWDNKDRRISRQGCVQIAVQVAGTFEEAVILADKMLEYVNRK